MAVKTTSEMTYIVCPWGLKLYSNQPVRLESQGHRSDLLLTAADKNLTIAGMVTVVQLESKMNNIEKQICI